MLKKSIQRMYQSNFMINSIEGNIGSGKSTILAVLASRNKLTNESMPEPIAEWTNMVNGVDLLKNFYEENEKWTFAFENLVQLSRLKSFYEAKERFKQITTTADNINNKKNIFIERSLLSSYNVFVMNSYEQNRMNKIEFDILTEYYLLFSDRMRAFFEEINQYNTAASLDNNIDLDTIADRQVKQQWPFRIIYLRTSPEICFERIKTRNRESESTISLAYLKQIHRKYDDWISRIGSNNKTLVEIVDADQGISKIVKQIESFL